jgi:hypothetical protein
MLNKPVPYNLYVKDQRLQILEHNTLVRYGFSHEPLKPIFDPEIEQSLPTNKIHLNFNVNEPAKPVRKRKQEDKTMKVSSMVADKHISKKKKTEQLPKKHVENIVDKECQNSMQHILEHQILPAGCRWSTSDWSCAYDSFFMIFFYLHLFAPEMWRQL